MLKSKMMIGLIAVLSIIAMSSVALATPSIGVATNVAYRGGDGQTALDDYQDYFVDTFLPGTNETHGFIIGPSGSDLIVWADSSLLGIEIYLMTTSTVVNDNSPTIDGKSFTAADIGGANQIDGYLPADYFAVSVGAVDTATWTALPTTGPNKFPGSNANLIFYTLNVKLDYTGTIAAGQYIFAFADVDGDGVLDPNSRDFFSPKTDSATNGHNVPEPGMLALFGMGLFGMAFFRRK